MTGLPPSDEPLDVEAAEAWIAGLGVVATGPLTVVLDRPWSIVSRVETEQGLLWHKQCGVVQRQEVQLATSLSERWSDLVGQVLGHDVPRAWLLLADAGRPLGAFGNPPDRYLEVLPRYAELQRGEQAHVTEHLAAGVPDNRLGTLASRFADVVEQPLPIEPDEVAALRAFTPTLATLCDDLASAGIGETIQHDDLHRANVFVADDHVRILDWGDATISHPFASLVTTFRFLEEENGLSPDDPWFARLRDAYLEPWGPGLVDACELGVRVGCFAIVVAWWRLLELLPAAALPLINAEYAKVLRRAIRRIPG